MTETYNPKGWPRGAGSLQKRGNVLWMIWTDANGKLRQESTGQTDVTEARAMLAAEATKVLQARIAQLARFAQRARITQLARLAREAKAQGHGEAGTGRSGRGREDRKRITSAPRNRKTNEGGKS
jgi:hypothetical protein